MPLDTIYTTRHGHRLNWTINYQTGEYKAQFPTPTGNPADPTLTSHGVTQSEELAAYLVSPGLEPKPFRVYSSPFYRCLQTIKPGVEALKGRTGVADDERRGLDVRVENGVGEWFGPTSWFDHPSPSSPSELHAHFPSILPPPTSTTTPYKPHIHPSTRGETIAQLHDRLATALSSMISSLDAEIAALEAPLTPEERARSSKAILICSHAAPLIAMGRALTGRMPEDSCEEDINVFTAGLSRFERRKRERGESSGSRLGERESESESGGDGLDRLAPGTKVQPGIKVPDWKGGRGVGGGWDLVVNGDCSFLSAGAERGWHFNGEESFDTGPMAPPSAFPASTKDGSIMGPGTKL